MPTINTTPVYTNIFSGSCAVFLNVASPAAAARIALESPIVGGIIKPDPTANPNGKWLGKTKQGLKFNASETTVQFTTDEDSAPFRTIVTEEKCELIGDFAEILDFARLALLLPNATRVTGSGFDQITVGGLGAFSTMPIAVIGPQNLDPTKAFVLMIYSAFSSGGLSLDLQRKVPNYSPFKFDGQMTSRAAGDQLWTLWEQV